VARHVVIYLVVHQPRRLKLPAQPILVGATPRDIEGCLFDPVLDEGYFRQVARRCYWPATELFLDLVGQGLKLNLGLSFSFVRQAQRWDPDLLALFQRLVAHPGVELIGMEPYHSFVFLADLPRFVTQMRWMRSALGDVFGQSPRVTDTTELCMSDGISLALAQAGFAGGFIDGRPWVLDWRRPTYLYRAPHGLALLTRHPHLSDDVGYRFSDRSWSGWPLMADTYAGWLAAAAGELVVLGWDYETFGEHHAAGTGIFDFVRRLPAEVHARHGRFLTASDAIAEHGAQSYELPLPVFPASWAGSGGLDFFLGNAARQAVFQLMLLAYNKARLTRDRDIMDLALWLLQSDHLHLIQWFGRQGAEAEVSAYFTPAAWWRLGREGIVRELVQVYLNFVRAIDLGSWRRRRRDTGAPPILDPEIVGLVRSARGRHRGEGVVNDTRIGGSPIAR
jgi:alpha-amylase